MSFTSLIFIGFLALLCTVYFLTPKKYRWITLLIASYVFYISAGVQLLVFLIFSTASSFLAAHLLGHEVEKYKLASSDTEIPVEKVNALKISSARRKKLIIALVIVINFSVLVFFKYANVLTGYINIISGYLGTQVNIPRIDLLLPLGISFYTFQSMGYLIDVYRGKYAPDKNIAKFALFVSFFPQLIQGPISRYDDLASQLYKGHSFDYVRAKHGIMLMLWGFFKKMVIGDRIAILVGTVFSDYTQYSGMYIVIAIIMYSIQIYADFSGGVDIALGAAEVIGIKLPQNFERPYFAMTLPDFWRRWHVTLNSWWRDYVFYPVTFSKGFLSLGKKCRKFFGYKMGKLIPVFFATMLVRVINAFWHGASIKFLAFGLYHGFLIILGLQTESFFLNLAKKLKINTECFSWKLFRIVRTFLLVCIGRVFICAISFKESIAIFKSMFTMFESNTTTGINILFDGSLYTLGMNINVMFVLFLSILVLLIADIMKEKGMSIRQTIEKQNIVFQWIVIILAFITIAIFGVYGPNYNPTDFIYQQF